MPEVTFTDEETWFNGLAGVVIAAGGLITDPDGRVLLVKPNYRQFWGVPGGICELREPPQVGCGRELAEEIGLPIPVGRLLAVDWGLPLPGSSRSMMHFIFDGGELADGSQIVLQAEELDDYRFTAPGEFGDYLNETGLRRISSAVRAKKAGTTIYVPQLAD